MKGKNYVGMGLILACAWHTNAFADQGEIKVRWTPAIYVDKPKIVPGKPEDLNAVFDAMWSKSNVTVVFVKNGKGTKKETLHSCNDLLSVEHNLVSSEDPTDWRVLMGWILQCKAMKITARLKPSRKTYFVQDVLSLAPELAKLKLKSESTQITTYFDGLNEEFSEKKCFTEFVCRIVTKAGDIYVLSLLSSGDYNHDGIEDMILEVSSGSTTGTYSLPLLFILSRETPGAELKVLYFE